MDHQHDHMNSSLEEVWNDYKPLIVIVIFCFALSIIQNDYRDHHFMSSFMGYFFIFLSLFKFFNLEEFVEGFATYDLVTKQVREYGYAYPFIEFFLGAAYLAKFGLFFV